MPTEADLLHGIAHHPGEVERWLVLSDWLEDHGDPRAELARLRYSLHALRAVAPASGRVCQLV